MNGPFQCSLSVMNVLLKIPSYSAAQPHKCSLPCGNSLQFIGLLLGGVIRTCGHVYPDSCITLLNSLSTLEVCDGHFSLYMMLIRITQINLNPFPSQIWFFSF